MPGGRRGTVLAAQCRWPGQPELVRKVVEKEMSEARRVLGGQKE